MVLAAASGDATPAEKENPARSFKTGETYEVVKVVDDQALSADGPNTVEEHVREYFSDIPIMVRIASCESEFRHTNTHGETLRGEINPKDLGVMQINEYFHGKTAKALDLNLHKLDDNLAYARYLYKREGVQPWASSAPCWKSDQQIAQK